MTEYKVWAFARSAAPNLPALEDQLADVMREADRRGYIIVNSCMEQKYGTEFWRPALFAMLTAVQQGRVNVVMVQSLDRLSHDLTTLYRILRFLQNHGAVLITTKTNLQYECTARFKLKSPAATASPVQTNARKNAGGTTASTPFPNGCTAESVAALISV